MLQMFFQKAKIERWCIGFPKMGGMLYAKVDHSAGKIYLVQKNTKNGLSERTKIGIAKLWEDLEAKLLTPGQRLG